MLTVMESHSDTATHVGNASYAESDLGDCAFGFAADEASPGTAGNPGVESVGTPTDRSQRTGTAGISAARKKQGRSAWMNSKASSHGKSTEGHHAAHQVSFYKPPHQAKAWVETDPIHHFDPSVRFDSFGLFFDLIFVGGAYAAGNLLKSGLHPHGVMMFISVMLVLRDVWYTKMLRDSQFHFNSAFHSLVDMVHLVLVMLLCLHIETVDRMADASTNAARGFSIIGLTLQLLELARDIEISKTAESQAGRNYWKYGVEANTVGILAFAYAIWMAYTHDDLELIWIPWIVSSELQIFGNAFLRELSMWRGTQEEHQVPVNLTFHIRRNAEWAMLMLGESIFSLLIVPVDHSLEFIIVFVLGTATVANVYYHYFELYEEMPKYHAMSISTKKGLLFFITRTYLSVSLVALGISFKIMLLNLDDEVLPVKYANVFASPFAVSLMLSDFAALLHDNGTAGVMDYFHIIAFNLDKPIGRSLALLWLGKFAIYGAAFAIPSFALDAMGLAAAGCGLSFFASLLVVLQSEPATDITVLSSNSTHLLDEATQHQQGRMALPSADTHDAGLYGGAVSRDSVGSSIMMYSPATSRDSKGNDIMFSPAVVPRDSKGNEIMFSPAVVPRDSKGNEIMFSPAAVPRDSKGNEIMFDPNMC